MVILSNFPSDRGKWQNLYQAIFRREPGMIGPVPLEELLRMAESIPEA